MANETKNVAFTEFTPKLQEHMTRLKHVYLGSETSFEPDQLSNGLWDSIDTEAIPKED